MSSKWIVEREGDEMHIFDTEMEAADFFDKTIGCETHGKEQWCDLYDECVREENIMDILENIKELRKNMLEGIYE